MNKVFFCVCVTSFGVVCHAALVTGKDLGSEEALMKQMDRWLLCWCQSTSPHSLPCPCKMDSRTMCPWGKGWNLWIKYYLSNVRFNRVWKGSHSIVQVIRPWRHLWPCTMKKSIYCTNWQYGQRSHMPKL